MKIGFLIDDHMHRAGGIQVYVRGLYHYFQSKGHEVVIFAGGSQFDNSKLAERVISLGVSIPTYGSGSSTSLPICLESNRRLREILAEEACDVLHVQSLHSPTLSGRLLANSKACHVSTFHIRVDEAWKLQALRLATALGPDLYRHIHGRIAGSRAALETAQAIFGTKAEYTIIASGITSDRFDAAVNLPRLHQYNDDKITLFTLGRLEQRKGVEYLLRAYALLQKDYPNQLRLVIAGDGPLREELQALAAQLRLTDVEWLGYVTDLALPHLMASADIFCAPAIGQESFGYVLVEAMAVGLPIVAAANAGYAGVIANHPGNLAVPPRDPRAMAGAIASFIASPAARKRLRQLNLQAAKGYSWQVIGDQIMDFYKKTMAQTMQ